MSDRIRIRFLRPYSVYRRGNVIEMDRGPAKSLIYAQIAAVDEQPQLVETATLELSEARTADTTPRRRRK